MIILRQLFYFTFVFLFALNGAAQALEAPNDTLYDLGLEELMKVNIASREAVSQTEAPGIITVITRDEIKNSGARNLVDVLMLVPGFQFATDYNGTLSLGVRGLWAIEGKVLLMVDGMDMNDLYYNSSLYHYAFPVDQISRIEVVRGPGSVIYGGAAEYAVINVITLSGEEINGAGVSVQHGVMEGGLERNGLGLTFGKKYGKNPDDLEVSFKAYTAHAGISGKDRAYPDGSSFSLEDSKQRIKNIYASAKYKGLTLRFNTENASVLARDAYGVPLIETSEVQFKNHVLQLDYDWTISKDLHINPTVSYKRSTPYLNEDPTTDTVGGGDASFEYNIDYEFTRFRLLLPASYKITNKLKLLFGLDFYHDLGRAKDPIFAANPADPTNLSDNIHFHSNAAFGELFWQSDVGTFSVGGRHENHNYFDSNFVPRLSWTKTHDAWNYKLLYSQAYRTPGIGNVHLAHLIGTTVEPEKTRVFEAEIGHRFNKNSGITLSLFDMLTKKTIVYDPITFGYTNGDQTGSYGAEVEFKQLGSWGFSNLAFSYHNTEHNRIDRFQVTDKDYLTAGFSNVKITWNIKYQMTQKFSIQPSFIYLGKRHGFDVDENADGLLETREVDPVITTNLFATIEDLGIDGLDFNFGVANLMDSNTKYLTSYDFGRNTMPGPSREYLIRLNYSWNF